MSSTTTLPAPSGEAPRAAAADRPAPTRPPLDSNALLCGCRFIEIRHNGEVYRLQATRLGKLILTK
ncbi:hemin uptake protein HemP [Ramlibacter sp.]|uniref:hemin uptake protein HemP n=1 Tax=Ramlibacter sp. TaxID=1917967 RepID=UPI002D2FEFFC|nr:hemin uptake protein HemP [Ramlibacter sp.]HYD75713.1 hemin uptake protein HemP [Ramlibacter sp.]